MSGSITRTRCIVVKPTVTNPYMSYLNIHEHKFDFRALVEKKSELLVKYSVNNWFVLCIMNISKMLYFTSVFLNLFL